MLLLDTGIVYRWLMDLPIPKTVAQRIRTEGAMVSMVSPWEMLIKHQIGKLELPTTDVADAIAEQGFPLLSITSGHLNALGTLPMLHRDPFDRLLLAQAKAEGAIIVSSDRIFREYLTDALIV